MAITVTVLRKNSGVNMRGPLMTAPSKTYGRAEQVEVQAASALTGSATPLVSPTDFTGATIVVDAAPKAQEGKLVLLPASVIAGGRAVASDWAIVELDTTGKAHGTLLYADNAVDGAVDWASTSGIKVGHSLGAASATGYAILKPSGY